MNVLRQELQSVARSVLFVRDGCDQGVRRSVYASAERFQEKPVFSRTGCIPSQPQNPLRKFVQTFFSRQVARLRNDERLCEKNPNFLNRVFLRRFRTDQVIHGGSPVVENEKSTGGAA